MIETVRIALSGLAANKLRSALTILGLTIGVGSVIVLVAVGTGSSDQVQASIEALGSNVLLVQPDAHPRRPARRRRGQHRPADRRRRQRAAEPVHRAGRGQRLSGRQRHRA